MAHPDGYVCLLTWYRARCTCRVCCQPHAIALDGRCEPHSILRNLLIMPAAVCTVESKTHMALASLVPFQTAGSEYIIGFGTKETCAAAISALRPFYKVTACKLTSFGPTLLDFWGLVRNRREETHSSQAHGSNSQHVRRLFRASDGALAVRSAKGLPPYVSGR